MTHDSHVCTDNCTSGRLEELLFAPHTASRMEPTDALAESGEMVTIPAELWRDVAVALESCRRTLAGGSYHASPAAAPAKQVLDRIEADHWAEKELNRGRR